MGVSLRCSCMLCVVSHTLCYTVLPIALESEALPAVSSVVCDVVCCVVSCIICCADSLRLMRDAFESKALKALWLEEREHVRKSIAKQQVSRVFTAPTLCCAVLCCAALCCAVLC